MEKVTITLWKDETHPQINEDGTRKRGRPIGSRKQYIETPKNSTLLFVPCIINHNPSISEYATKGLIRNVQIEGSRVFAYLRDGSFIEV